MPMKSWHFSFMAYYTYILKSKIKDKYYIGYCEDLTKRLEKHNSGNSRSTKSYIPWEIVYYEEYSTKSEAIKREYALKRIRNKEVLLKIINKDI
jgi:putative endonuclease